MGKYNFNFTITLIFSLFKIIKGANKSTIKTTNDIESKNSIDNNLDNDIKDSKDDMKISL